MITNLKLFSLIVENMKQGKLYVSQHKIDQNTLDQISNIDPSPTKKYVGWLAKMYINNNYDISSMKSYIEEFDVLVNKHKIEGNEKSIDTYKTIDDLKKKVDHLNAMGSASLKEAESDFEVILDNENIYVVSPNTHEASRKLGLTTFAHRESGDSCDSAWCTTYKNDSHFNDYFYKNNVTFYYTLVKNKDMIKQLGGSHMSKIAFAVLPNGDIDAYDANDTQIKQPKLDKVRSIIGI